MRASRRRTSSKPSASAGEEAAATSSAPAENRLFALNIDLLCLIIDKLPDARDSWTLLSTCRKIRQELASQPLESRPLLQLGGPQRYFGYAWYVQYYQAVVVMKTNACRVEAAVVSGNTQSLEKVDLPLLLKFGGRSLKNLALFGVEVSWELGFNYHLPLKQLSLECCSVGVQLNNPMVLAGLRQLCSLEELTLLSTDVCTVRGLAKHPSLTSLTVGDSSKLPDDVGGEMITDLSGIYKIPKLTYLNLSEGLVQGDDVHGFKLGEADYKRIGKCKALTTLHVPVCGGDDELLYNLARCPRLEKIVLYMGRGWDELDGDVVSHDFLCSCPALKSVRSCLGWMDEEEGPFFRSLAKKLARSHPGILVALPYDTNDYPVSGEEVPVEECVGDGDESEDENIDDSDGGGE